MPNVSVNNCQGHDCVCGYRHIYRNEQYGCNNINRNCYDSLVAIQCNSRNLNTCPRCMPDWWSNDEFLSTLRAEYVGLVARPYVAYVAPLMYQSNGGAIAMAIPLATHNRCSCAACGRR